MIVHISMAKYKDEAEGRTKAENIERGKAMTMGLFGEVPSIVRMEVGEALLHGPNDYDVVSYSEYADMDAVKATVANPLHDALIAFLKNVTEVSHSVTFERS